MHSLHTGAHLGPTADCVLRYAADDKGDGAVGLTAVPMLTTAPVETAKKGEDDARLGMRLTGVGYDVMMDNDLLSDFGLRMASAGKGGPAARVGISAGDVIAKADGYDAVYLGAAATALAVRRRRGAADGAVDAGGIDEN